MCGICCVIATSEQSQLAIDDALRTFLLARGPDSYKEVHLDGLLFCGSVLHMRSTEICSQPLNYDSKTGRNLLLFNGELFDDEFLDANNTRSDVTMLYNKLTSNDVEVEVDEVGLIETIARLTGPWSLIYYQVQCRRLWFGRDVIGRRSLLLAVNDGTWLVSSIAPAPSSANSRIIEIPAGLLISLDFADCFGTTDRIKLPASDSVHCTVYSLRHNASTADFLNFVSQNLCGKVNCVDCSTKCPRIGEIFTTTNLCATLLRETELNKSPEILEITASSEMEIFSLVQLWQVEIDVFLSAFTQAVCRRVRGTLPPYCQHCRSQRNDDLLEACSHSKIAILFSGGVDSLLVAVIAHKTVPENECIDLLNVAFGPEKNNQSDFHVPDRRTGLAALCELQRLCPGRRWRFVQSNVDAAELGAKRISRIRFLIFPANTVLDDSIGCTTWFAARGQGIILGENMPYTSPARVILMGTGADELLGGYSRHRVRFNQESWQGLADELFLELQRIGSRNLGRDDRIVSDHGRELRLPFLDEDFLLAVNKLPLQARADLRLPRGIGEKLILRLALWKLGFRQAALEPKRAMQFGARIAKLERSKEKGNDHCDRLLTE